MRLLASADDGNARCGKNEWGQIAEYPKGPTETAVEGDTEGASHAGEDAEESKKGEGQQEKPNEIGPSTS